jgi:hypothetical protein
MNVRFFKTAGLRQVASGLARLPWPTPDVIDHLVSQMSTLADIAADALGRLGQRLLGDLCGVVSVG